MAGGREYEPRKLQELIVYIARRLEGDARFGSTKLNKVLFYADFEAYRRRGSSITGAVYQRLPNGPAAHQLLPAMKALSDSGAIAERRVLTAVGTQRQPVAMREADTSIFDGTDIATVEDMIERLRPLTASQVSSASHETKAWRLTDDYQEIPYGAAHFASRSPSKADLKWLEGVANGRVAS